MPRKSPPSSPGLEQLAQELAGAPSGADTYSLRALGSILHDFYSGVERIFVRIAGELNGGVPQAERWHQELLGDMVLEIPKVRPAVIDADLATALGEYLRFRHLFRNVYGSGLEADRLQALADRLPATLAAFRERIQEFLSWSARRRFPADRPDHRGQVTCFKAACPRRPRSRPRRRSPCRAAWPRLPPRPCAQSFMALIRRRGDLVGHRLVAGTDRNERLTGIGRLCRG